MQTTITAGTVGTVTVANSVIQNLGPGILYVDVSNASVNDATGVRLDVGQAISCTGGNTLYGYAAGGDCDVRSTGPATGLHR